jgi:hypothetical protein
MTKGPVRIRPDGAILSWHVATTRPVLLPPIEATMHTACPHARDR